MDINFWQTRWEDNEIGFHQDRVNPYLKTHWPYVQAVLQQQHENNDIHIRVPVFVPLCGKSPDLLWLHKASHPVVGVEVSSIAVQDFFREKHLPVEAHSWKQGKRYASGDIEIYCGDFFALQAEELTHIGVVYDRASLIAFPESMRQHYIEHLQAIVPAHAPILLITLEYDMNAMRGPPFSVTEADIRCGFASRYHLEKLSEVEVIDENPKFRRRGLNTLQEKTFLLRPIG